MLSFIWFILGFILAFLIVGGETHPGVWALIALAALARYAVIRLVSVQFGSVADGFARICWAHAVAWAGHIGHPTHSPLKCPDCVVPLSNIAD